MPEKGQNEPKPAKHSLSIGWEHDEWHKINQAIKPLRVKTPTAVIRSCVLEVMERLEREGKLPPKEG